MTMTTTVIQTSPLQISSKGFNGKEKVKLNKQESENLMPIIWGSLIRLRLRWMHCLENVESKEKKISVMVSRIKRPDEKTSQIKVQSVEFSKGFLDKVRRKGKKKDNNQSGMMTLDKNEGSLFNDITGDHWYHSGDKSISHRAIIIGALANGVTHFNGFLCSDDRLNTLHNLLGRLFKMGHQ